MSQTIYIEKEVLDHPRTREVLAKLRSPHVIEIERYSEVFNRKNQNFRVQKEQARTFILAKKREHFVLPSPNYCPADTDLKFYFSHLFNCPYDCEYCFLQGMYRSAFFVLFVNYEDFEGAIGEKVRNLRGGSALSSNDPEPSGRLLNVIDSRLRGNDSNQNKIMFFASYDNDSLALEEITGFAKYFIPVFDQFEDVTFELRSKAAYTKVFEEMPPAKNTLMAWTLSPEEVQKQWEHKTASLSARIKALKKVQQLGWKTAIRIEPLIFFKGWEEAYERFFAMLKQEIDFSKIENLFFGQFRLPKDTFKTMKKMLPQSTLLTKAFEPQKDGEITYPRETEKKLFDFVYERVVALLPREKVFYYSTLQ